MTRTPDGPSGPDIMWAPWRIDYVASGAGRDAAARECVFCALPARGDDAAAYILHRGRNCYVVLNRYPYNNGHLMVVPFAHRDDLTTLDEATTAEMMTLTQRAQHVMGGAMRPHGFNIGINQGTAAGAGIADHLHLHVVPRWSGDTNFMPAIGDCRVMPQHLDATYELLKPGFSE